MNPDQGLIDLLEAVETHWPVIRGVVVGVVGFLILYGFVVEIRYRRWERESRRRDPEG